MPRFVILEHDWPYRHWDLLIEAGGILRAWRLKEFPDLNCEIPCEAIADHRVMYLNYEGPVSNDRGSVKRVESGNCEEDPTTEHVWKYQFSGSRGCFTGTMFVYNGKLTVRFASKPAQIQTTTT
ncbi:DNA polymerase ligase N-terminal domain-containing protein [Planctomicrobium sp. SH668]|uniref:DNA polymerase ligase N-terminal domain-containing protein n=1 Tax=Planctomicrobium sp. SH668 TaxID=3448126 RepID=UPI003F5B088E